MASVVTLVDAPRPSPGPRARRRQRRSQPEEQARARAPPEGVARRGDAAPRGAAARARRRRRCTYASSAAPRERAARSRRTDAITPKAARGTVTNCTTRPRAASIGLAIPPPRCCVRAAPSANQRPRVPCPAEPRFRRATAAGRLGLAWGPGGIALRGNRMAAHNRLAAGISARLRRAAPLLRALSDQRDAVELGSEAGDRATLLGDIEESESASLLGDLPMTSSKLDMRLLDNIAEHKKCALLCVCSLRVCSLRSCGRETRGRGLLATQVREMQPRCCVPCAHRGHTATGRRAAPAAAPPHCVAACPRGRYAAAAFCLMPSACTLVGLMETYEANMWAARGNKAQAKAATPRPPARCFTTQRTRRTDMHRSAPVLVELRQHRTAPAYKRAASLACHGHCTDAHGPGAPSACSPLREGLSRHDVFVVDVVETQQALQRAGHRGAAHPRPGVRLLVLLCLRAPPAALPLKGAAYTACPTTHAAQVWAL